MLRALTKERGIPPLYAQEHLDDPEVYMELLLAGSSWRWLVLEAELRDDDILFFGYVIGFENELGYFSANELMNAGLPVVPKTYSQPVRLSELKKRYG